MVSSRVPTHRCSLAIAGLPLTIESSNTALIDALRVQYAAFFVEETAPAFTLQVQIESYPDNHATERPFEFRSSVLRFTAPYYSGAIDVTQPRARLLATTKHSAEDADYGVRAAYALLVFQAGGLLFHAAGIAHRTRGYLFYGHSGSGKTTVARNSSNDRVLNDDLVVLFPRREQWIIHATPFSNPTQFNPSGPHQVALSKMFRLVQDRQVYLEQMEHSQHAAEVIASTPIIPADPGRSLQLIDRAARLAREVPAYRLHFLPDDSFWSAIDASES